jgi:hypothetical protein
MRERGARAEAASPIADGIVLEHLKFRYEISGDQASWRPLRAFDDGEKVADKIRFAAVGASANFDGLVGDDGWIVLTHKDDIDLGNLAAEDTGGIEAVHAGHADVHQDDVGLMGTGELDGLLAVGSLAADLQVGAAGEHHGDDVADAGIVIY